MSALPVIPVLDLRGGKAVHAVAGRRNEYRVVESVCGHGSDVVSLARGLLTATASRTLYVADLDAILSTGDNSELLRQLCQEFPDVEVWYDAGGTRGLSRHGSVEILSTEGLDWLDFDQYAQIVSIDLHQGALLGPWHRMWAHGVVSQWRVAEMAAAMVERTGARTVIVLDLARVGTSEPDHHLETLARVRAALPSHVRLVTGGGLRTAADTIPLAQVGVDAVLVATALHRGTWHGPAGTSAEILRPGGV